MFGRRKRADLKILKALADGEWHYGPDVMRQTKLTSRRFYASMDRLIEYGTVQRLFVKFADQSRTVTYRLTRIR